jgi:hypothetical protein
MDTQKYSDYYNLIPGFVQGMVRVTISYPFDSVKVYMQKGIYPSTISAFKNIVKSDPRILYRGSSLSFTVIPMDRSIQFFMAEKLNKNYNAYLSGLISGTISSLYSVPLQYITTNAILSDRKNYTNLFKFIKNLNFKKFYNGYTIEYSRSLLGTTTYMGTYLYLRNNVNPDYQLQLAPVLGCIANITAWMVMFPLDTIRTFRQTTDNSTVNIVSHIYRTRGFKGFYLGITPVIFRTIPSASIGMFAYEYTKKWLFS